MFSIFTRSLLYIIHYTVYKSYLQNGIINSVQNSHFERCFYALRNRPVDLPKASFENSPCNTRTVFKVISKNKKLSYVIL